MALADQAARKPSTKNTSHLDHGMYSRPTSKRERSAQSRAEAKRPWLRDVRQGLKAESASILSAEVRCLRSSDEAGQCPWSEGGHGRVNQHNSTEAISEVGSAAAPNDERCWIHEAAERRKLCAHAGSSARRVDSERRRRARCSKWNHQPKSRVRENRTHGSERSLSRSRRLRFT